MLIRVKVKPGSKTDSISWMPDGVCLIKIKAPPIDGKANDYLIKFLAQTLNSAKTRSRLNQDIPPNLKPWNWKILQK
jgi:uncharacterized protein (TIGR00251 family)